MKGVITSAEANALRNVPSASGVPQLLNLLKEKGVVTDADLVQAKLATALPANAIAVEQTSSYGTQATSPPATSQERAIIPQLRPCGSCRLICQNRAARSPTFRLGSGANIKIYGFLKATAVSDTASSGGATFGSNDFPLPLAARRRPPVRRRIRSSTSRTRSFRIGSQFEWVPKSKNLTLTGRLEADFEGDYTNVNNRNISSARSSQFSIRLAYMRLDTKLGGRLPWFGEFGQDWRA